MKFARTLIYILIAILVVLVLAALFSSLSNFPSVSKNKWQAVFLNNSQVYFGHIVNINRGYVGLKDIYYLQATQPLQQGAQAQPDLSLIKLGGELHGPEDFMYLPKTNIVFWENLKDDSQVVQAIRSFQTQRQ